MTVNRLEVRLAAQRALGAAGLAPYITAGDGGLEVTRALLEALEVGGELQKLKGIGPVTERIIREIVKTGTANYYKKLMI